MLGYAGLYRRVRDTMNAAHLEGELKAEVMAADPERFVVLDAELAVDAARPQARRQALLLVTNSEWELHARDDELRVRSLLAESHELARAVRPGDRAGRQARLLRGAGAALPGRRRQRPAASLPWQNAARPAYHRWARALVEEHLGLAGDEILYVGDHVYADVHVSSRDPALAHGAGAARARARDRRSAARSRPEAEELAALMADKSALEREQAQLRLCIAAGCSTATRTGAPHARHARRRSRAPARAARSSRARSSPHRAARPSRRRARQARWGPLMRAGQRQEPARAPDRALRRHLHVTRVESAAAHAVRLSARAARKPAARQLSTYAAQVCRRRACYPPARHA